MSGPTPDLKPHVPPPPPGSEACGCCDGIAAETPRGVFNRGGLSAVAYRIGEYPKFRASVQAALSSATFAPLAQLRTRAADDFTIGLIDAFACAADVLTFYQERIANESYLRTATERVSLQEMGKLIGYRLRPGVAAETWLAFALDMPPTPPATLPPEPGNFVTGVPASLKLDAGLKVQSVPGPDEKPQTFETVEALADARPAWNAMRPWMGETGKPLQGHTSTYLKGLETKLRAGDGLVILGGEFVGDPTSTKWEFRIIEKVEPDTAADRTLVRWKRGLGASKTPANPQVHVLRKHAGVFGNNAPMWGAMSLEFRNNYPDSLLWMWGLATQWPNFVISPKGSVTGGGYIDLDAIYGEVHAAAVNESDAKRSSYAVLAKGSFNSASEPPPADAVVQLYRVTNVAEESRAEFAISGKVTRLELHGANYAQFSASVRETVAFVQSEFLPLADYPVDTAVSGATVPVNVPADGLFAGRRLIVRGRTSGNAAVVHLATLVQAHPNGAARCNLEIAPELPTTLVRDSVVVHANVALASHGESVSQILGAGDASVPFQRFELKQTPLTYRAAGNETGVAAELTVRVNDIAWNERSTMYGAASVDHAYTLVTDEQGRNFVSFGDGIRGARLPSGVNNVRASYRKGIGAAGNVAADKLTQLMTRPLGLKSVSNLLRAEGGTDPEAATAARRSMPLATRTLGRAVSILDYEDYAAAFSGIAKAQARVLHAAAGPIVAITIAGPDAAPLTPASPVWIHLLDALRANGDPHVSVVLLPCQMHTFQIGLKVKRDPSYEAKVVLAAVEAALRAHYAFDARELGQPVHQSDVIAVAQAVPGVTAVDTTFLYGGSQPWMQTYPSNQVRLLASRMHVQGGVAQPAELLTLAPGPLHQLEEMP